MKLNSLLIFISILISLISIEFFLYLDNYSPKYKNFSYTINKKNYLFNDNPKILNTTKNEKVILFLGDSMTKSTACSPKKKDFVNIIKIKKEKKEEDIKIFNFSDSGIGPADYINIYNHFKSKINHLFIVLYYNDIDIGYNDCLVYKSLEQDSFPEVKLCDLVLKNRSSYYNDTIIKKIDNFFSKTRIWLFLRNKLVNIKFLEKYYGRVSLNTDFIDESSIKNQQLINNLKYLKNDAKKNKIETTFLYFPDIYYLKELNTPNKIFEKFILIAKKNEITINSPLKTIMKKKTSENMSWSLIDTHANCDAHKIMANYIVNLINHK